MNSERDKSIALKIAIRIKTLRKNRGLTQEKLGELSGLEYKHIQLLESSNPPNARIDSINKIANALGISLHEFFSDEMFKEKPKETKKKNYLLKAKSANTRKVLFEDSYWYAQYYHPSIARGHIVIYSKREVQNYFELYPEENYALIEMQKKVYKFLMTEFKPDGFNIGADVEIWAGQEFNTVAVHIIPRYKGDSRNPLHTGIRKVLGV